MSWSHLTADSSLSVHNQKYVTDVAENVTDVAEIMKLTVRMWATFYTDQLSLRGVGYLQFHTLSSFVPYTGPNRDPCSDMPRQLRNNATSVTSVYV